MNQRILFGVLGLVTAGSLWAGGLSKTYKEWPKTPEAYFLTGEEKAAWKKVKSDDEAEKFVAEYRAKRGDEFWKALEPRIAAADKYFSAGNVKGSQTLRGKVIVMFGPPSDISRDAGSAGEGMVTQNNLGMGGSGGGSAKGGGGGADALSSGSAGAQSAPPPPIKLPTFSFAYDGEAAPKAIGKPFRVELNVISNADQEPSDPKDLEQKFETVAQASIRKTNN